MVPILFWAVLAAVQERTAGRYVALAVVSCLHLLAGHIQIAMLSGITAPLFGVWYLWLTRAGFRCWFRDSALAVGAFGLGNALGALQPVPDARSDPDELQQERPEHRLPHHHSRRKHRRLLHAVPARPAVLRVLARPGRAGRPIDWDDLFAFSGLVPAAIVAVALPGRAPTNAAWSAASSSSSPAAS